MFQSQIGSSYPLQKGLFILFFLAHDQSVWCPLTGECDNFGEEQNHEKLLDLYFSDNIELDLCDLRILAIGSYEYQLNTRDEPGQVKITNWTGHAYGETIQTDEGTKAFALEQIPIALKNSTSIEICEVQITETSRVIN